MARFAPPFWVPLIVCQLSCHADDAGRVSPSGTSKVQARDFAAVPRTERQARHDSPASGVAEHGQQPSAGEAGRKEATHSHEAETGVEAPPLPRGVEVGIPTEHPMPRDRSLRITHAHAGQRRALIYLHGMCGNSKGADPWADVSKDYGTLIVVRATIPCEDRPGFRWSQDVDAIHRRIESALHETKQLRGGQLDTDQVALFGYSQGANRAEKLAGLHPARYPWVVLGGTPTVAVPERLLGTEGVAFLGGELEDVSHMVAGMERVREEGRRARFFLLPSVHHGSYGPHGPEVVRSALEYVFFTAPERKSAPFFSTPPMDSGPLSRDAE